jgi:1-deoxy-D-xylulose-5-phosphate synthase
VEIKKGNGKSWTNAFADAMIELGRSDPRLVALTAGMPDGTGLSRFEKVFPRRYHDTGICESHLMAMAAGMAKSGLRPVAAIYSTFIQRAFDQVWQEVALNHQPVILAMDRAGYVGDDGAVHHGFMDQAFLRPMPEMVLMAPSDEAELRRCLRLAVSLECPAALRYPRDNIPARDFEAVIDPALRGEAMKEWRLGKSRVLRQGEDGVLLVYGALMDEAMKAATALAAEGIELEVIDARFCKPLDGAMLSRVLSGRRAVVTVEDHALQNGFGSAVLEYAAAHHLPAGRITRLGHPDRLIHHASRAQQLAEAGLDAAGIAAGTRVAVAAEKRAQGNPEAAEEVLAGRME